ncbi:uncharacterized protein METZ01_LOCUS166386 [marine metagenome]|uniref:Uncharacterized protein n=1 Tax=marine metagenome TaxID=408172 RepID=A0A382BJS3_9ZZZZ
MNTIRHRADIDKCILSFSHDRYLSRKKANAISIAKAEREVAASRKGVSHLILRAVDDQIDCLKFLFLINGIPVMCYALGNLLISSLKEIVIIGSEEVERISNAFLETVGTHGKHISFIREDPNRLNLFNTMQLGRNRMSMEPDELILFQPGDLPFMFDIENILKDNDIKSHNLILWLNSRQMMFPRYKEDPESEFVQRNYHYRALCEETNELHEIKEPNVYPINLSAVDPNIIDHLHLTRKDGNIIKAGIRQAMSMPSRILKLLPIMAYHALHFKADLKQFRKEDKYQFGMHRDNFHRAVSILLDTEFTTKFHSDPSFVSDVDALEDWEDFESLTHYAEARFGEEGLTHIHPFGEELIRFREEKMPDLKNHISMYKNFPTYINLVYQSLKMRHVPFSNGKQYTPVSLDLKKEPHTQKTEHAFFWYSKKCGALKV